MGFIVTATTVLIGLFGRAVSHRIARAGRYLGIASALLLLMTGAYVVHYWLTAGGLVG